MLGFDRCLTNQTKSLIFSWLGAIFSQPTPSQGLGPGRVLGAWPGQFRPLFQDGPPKPHTNQLDEGKYKMAPRAGRPKVEMIAWKYSVLNVHIFNNDRTLTKSTTLISLGFTFYHTNFCNGICFTSMNILGSCRFNAQCRKALPKRKYTLNIGRRVFVHP